MENVKIQELVHERAAIYFNFICKYLKSCSLDESELCLILTLACGLTSLLGFGPFCSPWPCPDITGLCLTLGLLTGHDAEPLLCAHVLTRPWAISVHKNTHDDGRDRIVSGFLTPGWRDRMSPGCLTLPWQTPGEPPAPPVLILMEPSVSDVSWQCLLKTGAFYRVT